MGVSDLSVLLRCLWRCGCVVCVSVVAAAAATAAAAAVVVVVVVPFPSHFPTVSHNSDTSIKQATTVTRTERRLGVTIHA